MVLGGANIWRQITWKSLGILGQAVAVGIYFSCLVLKITVGEEVDKKHSFTGHCLYVLVIASELEGLLKCENKKYGLRKYITDLFEHATYDVDLK